MKHRVLISVVLSVVGLGLAVGCERSDSPARGEQPSAALELGPMAVTVFGKHALLFVEHPPLVRGVEARFLAHLTVMATGEAVRAGRVVLEIGAWTLVAEGPRREGLFVPQGSIPDAGAFAARLTVTSDQVEETLDLGEMRVHESAEAARLASASAVEAEPSNEIPFLLEQQWRMRLLVAEAEPRSLGRRLILPAQTRAPEGAVASVAAPTAGRFLAPLPGSLPRSGDRVEAGQVLGWIEPPLVASDVAQLRALSLDFDLKALEVARSVASARARLRFAERERERIGKLREVGLSTQQQLDQAEQNWSVAGADEEVARATKDSLDRLVADREARGAGSAVSALRLPLHAPIAGTLVAAGHVAGESIGAEVEIFRILDASRLWIEGRASEFDLPQVSSAPPAYVSFPALPGMRLDVPASGVANAYISPEIDPASRTFLIRYEFENSKGELKAGMLAQLELVTAHVDAGVAIPAEALVMDQGIPTAYVMLSGETFQRRELELGVRDGEFVEVLRGIAPRERVVTRGAHLLRLAALSPASFGAGHAH